MSFGLLKQFKGQKKNIHGGTQLPFANHVIIGQDLAAILKLVELRRQFPDETIKIITTRPLSKDHLLECHERSVALIRSSESAEKIYRSFFDAKLLAQRQTAVFYKDGKFHDFGGRARPLDLLADEDIFTNTGFYLQVSSLFGPDVWSSLDEVLAECQEVRLIGNVEKLAPNDLVHRNEWMLDFKDFTRLACENLYISMAPKKFLGLLANKESITPELVGFCSSGRSRSGIFVSWTLDGKYEVEERTYLVPQSMTHEWGHFIVEFQEVEEEQRCHVFFFIHDENSQTEDLASKIKLMKRVLDRVFPHLEARIKKEFIRLDEDVMYKDMKLEALEQVGFDYPCLKFLNNPLLN